MTALFSKPSIPQPIVPGPAPQRSDAEVLAVANQERQRLAAAAGRNATILAGTDTAPQASAPRTLLGAA